MNKLEIVGGITKLNICLVFSISVGFWYCKYHPCYPSVAFDCDRSIPCWFWKDVQLTFELRTRQLKYKENEPKSIWQR